MTAIVILLASLVGVYPSENDVTEANHKKWFGESAEANVINADGTWTDVLTDEYAVEVDWAQEKWKESLSQATLYAIHNKKKPAVMLLIKDVHRDKDDLLRCLLVCQHYDVPVFTHRVYKEVAVNSGDCKGLVEEILSGEKVLGAVGYDLSGDNQHRYVVVHRVGFSGDTDLHFVSGSQYLEIMNAGLTATGEHTQTEVVFGR